MTDTPTKDVAFYVSTGWSVEPCALCGYPIGPSVPRAVIPGEWRPMHAVCYLI